MLGLGVAIALVLSAGVVYGMMGTQTPPQQSKYAGSGSVYGGGMMGTGNSAYSRGTMGGFGGMMGGGYGGMMGGYGGMMGQFSQYMANNWNHMWNRTASGALVAIVNYGFYPVTLTVSKGTTVTWVNMDFVQHTVTAGSEQAPTGLFDSHELNHMQSFSYTFSTTGTYTYYCDVHPNMVGTIIVTG